MSEKPNKPRRDLRARLGKTITPKTAGGDAAAPPAGVGGAASSPTPAPAVKPPAGVAAPPAGIAAPPAGIAAPPFGGAPEVAAPPFAKPAAAPPESVDPFGASAGQEQAPQVVRLEFDDQLVTDKEVGKTARMRLVIVSAVVLAVGAGIGWGAGQMAGDRAMFDRIVRDAQSIYGSVDTASATIDTTQTLMNSIITAAAGNPQDGTAPRVDYESVEALRALAKPFEASAFSGKNYNALSPETVHDLFLYTQNIDRIWRELRVLAAETLAENRRAELDRTATATAEGASTNYGAVLSRNEGGQLVGKLAFLEIQAEEGAAPRVLARASRGGQAREFQVFAGNQQIGETAELVLLVDGAGSRGVLAEQTGAFGLYVQRIRDLKILIDETVEVQGRLLQSISRALTDAGASTRPTP